LAVRLVLYIRWLLLFLIAVGIAVLILRWRFPKRRWGLSVLPDALRSVLAALREKRAMGKEISINRKTLVGRSVLLAVPGEKEAKVLSWKLAAYGCSISRVRNGRQAVSAATQGVDVIIADSLLPDMSLADLVDALPAGTPLVLLDVTPVQVESIRGKTARVAYFYSGYDPDDVSTTTGRLLRSLDTDRV